MASGSGAGFSAVTLQSPWRFLLQRLGVAVAAVHHGGRHPAVRQEAAQPVEVLLVQDARHVLRLGEEPLQGRLEQLDLQEKQASQKVRKRVCPHHRMVHRLKYYAHRRKLKRTDQNGRKFLLDQHVVDGDASLAGTGGPFGPNYAVHSYLRVI